jgi:L-fuconolactonase
MRERPRGADYFNDEVWRDLKLLADTGQTLDVLMFEYSLADVDMIAQRIPNLKILINHVAGANIDGKSVDPIWARDLAQAGRNPNVYCKVSGLFQQSHQQPSPTDLVFYKPVLDELWKVFGEDRLVYGSNWPVTMRGGSYASYKAIVMEFLEPKGRTAMEKILAGNAFKFYGLK